jgi:hypothetical protein
VSEFDERVARAWAAVTRGDLTRQIEDLPPDRPVLVRKADRRTVPGHPVLRAVTKAWLISSVLAVVLWGLVGFVRADLIPLWWIWFVGPPGAVLSTVWYACDRIRHRHRPYDSR